jgi:hypothetical protein
MDVFLTIGKMRLGQSSESVIISPDSKLSAGFTACKSSMNQSRFSGQNQTNVPTFRSGERHVRGPIRPFNTQFGTGFLGFSPHFPPSGLFAPALKLAKAAWIPPQPHTRVSEFCDL